MTWAMPIDPAGDRRPRRLAKGDVLEDGEYIQSNIMVMDGKPSAAAYDSLAPELRDAARAYDEMMADYGKSSNRAPRPVGNVSDAEIAAAYDSMIADYQRDRR